MFFNIEEIKSCSSSVEKESVLILYKKKLWPENRTNENKINVNYNFGNKNTYYLFFGILLFCLFA